jgi:hypothetical protein
MFLELLCALSFFALVVGVVALILNVLFRAQLSAWQELSRTTGLRCEVKRFLGIPVSGQVVGLYQGYSIKVGTFTRRYYRTTAIYTFVNLPVANPRKLQLAISEKGFASTIMRWMGSQEVEMGDPTLDQRFAFRGSDETALRQLLTSSELRQALMRLRRFEYLEIKGQTLHFEQKGAEKDGAHLIFLLDLTTKVGRAFESL